MTDDFKGSKQPDGDVSRKRNAWIGLFAIALIIAALITAALGHSLAAAVLVAAESALALVFLAATLYSTEEFGEAREKIRKIIRKERHKA